MMILIADCGSTKINWTLLNGKEKVAQIFTTGMNALLLTEEEMKEQIKRELMPHLTNYKVDEIYYYGAGIVSDEIKQQVVNALRANLVSAVKVEVASDLLAAARAGSFIILRTTHRPEETVGGLVAYLNPTHIDTSVLDGLQNLTSMSSQRLTHLLIVHFLPRSRDVLLTRIGPPIAIVEVNHHDHSLLFSSFCHLDNIVLIT